MRAQTRFLLLAVVMISFLAPEAHPQDGVDQPMDAPVPAIVGVSKAREIFRTFGSDFAAGEGSRAGFSGRVTDFVADQKQIWTSPLRNCLSDTTWLVPLGGLAAGLFMTDRQYSASSSESRRPSSITEPFPTWGSQVLSALALGSICSAIPRTTSTGARPDFWRAKRLSTRSRRRTKHPRRRGPAQKSQQKKCHQHRN